MPKWPDYVRAFPKPPHTDIKYINGSYYLYDREAYYDPVEKKTKRKWGAIRGKITPEGKLVESVHRKKPAQASPESGAVKEGDAGSDGEGPDGSGIGTKTAAPGLENQKAAEQPASECGLPWGESEYPDSRPEIPDGMLMPTVDEADPSKEVMSGAVCFLYSITTSCIIQDGPPNRACRA